MEHTPSFPSFASAQSPSALPTRRGCFLWAEMKVVPPLVVFISKRAKPGLVRLGHHALHLSQLRLLQLDSEAVESKPLGSSSSRKNRHVFLCVILPIFAFLRVPQARDALDGSPGPRCGEKTRRRWAPQEHASLTTVTSHVADTQGSCWDICHQPTGRSAPD